METPHTPGPMLEDVRLTHVFQLVQRFPVPDFLYVKQQKHHVWKYRPNRDLRFHSKRPTAQVSGLT